MRREADLRREKTDLHSVRPGSVALLVNPNTTTGPRDIAIIHTIASRLGAVDLAMTCRDDPGGASLLERWFRLGVRAIAVIGGDGTLRSVLTAVHRAGRSHDFDIVLLDGGSFGLAARMLGAQDAWKHVLDSHLRSEPVRYQSLNLPTLMTASGIGFLVAAGAGASVSRDFQSCRRTRSQLFGYVATRVFDLVCGGESLSLLDGYRGALAYDGKLAPGERWIAVFITSLPQLNRRRNRQTPNNRSLYSLAFRFKGDANRAPSLFHLLAGRWASETRVSQTIQLESSQPFDVLLDGEIQQVRRSGFQTHPYGLTVRPGPTFRAWVPRAVGAPGLVRPLMPFELQRPFAPATRAGS